MRDAEVDAVFASAVDDLKEATGISSGDGVHAGGFDSLNFAIEQVVGHFRLNDVVDAGAAAAPGAFGKFDEFQAGDGVQDLARLRGDFLAVAQMASFVVSDGAGRSALC